jgi:glycosyltransferase involved in cell wall biosynthesis
MASRIAAGVCIVRDARDIVPFICGHYLRAGFDHVLFVDDGSSDGTFEFLSYVSSRTRRVSVRRVNFESFEQKNLINEATNFLIDLGYQIVVPFDSDEFWNVRAEELEKRYTTERDVSFFGRWVNFVQQRDATHPRLFGLFRVRYHAVSTADTGLETVVGFRRPFVSLSEKKVAFKTSRNVELTVGQHSLVDTMRTDSHELEIFHVPFRNRNEIEKRGVNHEPRRAIARRHSVENWQSAFHRRVCLTGRLNEVWAANSASRDGYLDVYGERMPLVSDNRLRRLLFNASAYLGCTLRIAAL